MARPWCGGRDLRFGALSPYESGTSGAVFGWDDGLMQHRKPPVLVVDFLHGGGDASSGLGGVILRRKGGPATELKPHIEALLKLQHAELQDGMRVWLIDMDGDISGKDEAPLAATICWSDESGWFAEYAWDEAESLG